MRRVLALGLLLSVLFVVGNPAHAQEATAAPSIVGTFDPDGEPCTGVPDAIPGVFDFTAACLQHDRCYAAGVNRLACDVAFRQALIASCLSQHPDAYDPRRYTCLALAELYYGGVRLFGGFSFPAG
jgi:hypothetical protein